MYLLPLEPFSICVLVFPHSGGYLKRSPTWGSSNVSQFEMSTLVLGFTGSLEKSGSEGVGVEAAHNDNLDSSLSSSINSPTTIICICKSLESSISNEIPKSFC